MRLFLIGAFLALVTGGGLYTMSGSDDSADKEWQHRWGARQQALEEHFGPADDTVLHSPIPFDLDGSADVLVFREHNEGVVYITADLIGDDRSKPNRLGQYELMICTPGDEDWAAQLVSHLAIYTIEAVLEPYDTMDIGPALPQPTELSAFLYLPYVTMDVDGQQAAVMLCMGITSRELAYIQSHDVEQLIDALKAAGVYPMTDLARTSVQLK